MVGGIPPERNSSVKFMTPLKRDRTELDDTVHSKLCDLVRVAQSQIIF